jgi:hypothetical protein
MRVNDNHPFYAKRVETLGIVFLIDILIVAAITIPVYLLLRSYIPMSSLAIIIYVIACVIGVGIGWALLRIMKNRKERKINEEHQARYERDQERFQQNLARHRQEWKETWGERLVRLDEEQLL